MESEDASWYSSLKEELYPEKENELRRSVSVYVESILSCFCFHILTFVPEHLNGE